MFNVSHGGRSVFSITCDHSVELFVFGASGKISANLYSKFLVSLRSRCNRRFGLHFAGEDC